MEVALLQFCVYSTAEVLVELAIKQDWVTIVLILHKSMFLNCYVSL